LHFAAFRNPKFRPPKTRGRKCHVLRDISEIPIVAARDIPPAESPLSARKLSPLLRRMPSRLSRFLFTAAAFAVASSFAPAAGLAPLSSLTPQAEKFHVALATPTYENTPGQLRETADKTIRAAEAALDVLAKQDPAKVTFDSTIAELDRIVAPVRNVVDRIGLIQETNPEKTVRDAASETSVKLSSWAIALDYRDDVYRIIKAFADTKPTLTGEEKLLFDETLRDYRRAGLDLPAAQRTEVERIRKELTQLTTDFSNNINQARGPLDFTAEELAGVPASFLESPGVKQPDGRYRVMMNITWHWQAVIENAKNENVRQLACRTRYNLAKEQNIPLLGRIVALRTDLALKLGYPTWADYQTETRMTKNAATALKFEEELVTGLQKKFDAELATLRELKAKDTGKPDAKLEPWDINYYTEMLKKERYSVDAEQLRVYFPYQHVLTGMFHIYEKIFGLTFTEVAPPQVWADGVRLFAVTDRATGEPLGLFYLDMFPRDGKYNHFACFTVSEGARRPDGIEEVPVASLVCNFPPPSADKPSLLQHEDVETLFHEFGHVMHLMLSRAKYSRHFAFGVPQDFVEAPSQMLENWVWDKAVLDTFAADYRDPSKKVPAEVIDSLKAARKATAAVFYRRQLSFGLLDLMLHTQTDPKAALDVAAATNDVLARVSVAPPPDTAFAAYFGHLMGYDAAYYGYLWSLSIAQDMASVFEASPDKFLDEKIGRRLRDEVYAAGASRDVSISVEKFLGRKQSTKPFLKFIGVE
jgi:thimet oligopeptidase